MNESIITLHEQPKEINQDYFNNYGGYNYSESYRDYTVSPYTVIASLAENDIYFETLLDAGCASGELVRDFRKLGIKAYGIEKNTVILKKSVIPEFCTEMNILDMSKLRDSSVEIIYCNALMYIQPQAVLSILKEFFRICEKVVYLCNPFLGESLFYDPCRVFLAKEIWWDHQFQEANFNKIAKNIYKKN